MNTILFQPTDVLFFRDGRPMSGSLAGHSAAWPLPDVTNHALHAALHRAKITGVHAHRRGSSGVYMTDHRDRKFGCLTTAGPFPVRVRVDRNNQRPAAAALAERCTWFFPRPADAGKRQSVGVTFLPIRPANGDAGIIAASNSLPLPLKYATANICPPEKEADGERSRVKRRTDGNDAPPEIKDSAWLFGSDDASLAWTGAIQFGEARLLAFPIRSARGSFGWITSPLLLRRAVREGVLPADFLPLVPSGQPDEAARFAKDGPLAIEDKVVLEEYTFTHGGEVPAVLGERFKLLLEDDPVWSEAGNRLVILSDGMMSFFAQNACEVAQHVRIDDRTGTAVGGALFNQENVPSETLFYSTLYCFDERTAGRADHERRAADRAAETFQSKIQDARGVFQFGGEASTGLGYCTVRLITPEKEGVE